MTSKESMGLSCNLILEPKNQNINKKPNVEKLELMEDFMQMRNNYLELIALDINQ